MQSRHLIDLSDLSVPEWEEITRLACDIRERIDDYYGVCRGKILATLFYEPSTRRRCPFKPPCCGWAGASSDLTIRATPPYPRGKPEGHGAGGQRLRRHHRPAPSLAGAPKAAALYSRVPVINAGDGGDTCTPPRP